VDVAHLVPSRGHRPAARGGCRSESAPVRTPSRSART
jgi:hypothetical protein